MEAAVAETVDEYFIDLHINVDSFYRSSEGRYSRIGQLAESHNITAYSQEETQ